MSAFDDSNGYIGRFAPSPTGPLHAGSLLSAFASWLRARQAGGKWLVRIEDIDPPREVPGAAQLQLKTLAAFGLQADAPVLYQSQRSAAYQAALMQLLDSGQAFFCHCSRSQLAANGGIHHACVTNAQRPDPAVRFAVKNMAPIRFIDALQGLQQQDVRAAVGDFVLRRADGLWAYQLAVVVDDAAQAVTEVVRGADLLDSTARQIALQQALALPTPAYLHVPLLCDSQGQKLSKSLQALPVDATNPLPLLQQCWTWLGQCSAPLAHLKRHTQWLDAAVTHFDATRLPRRIAPFSP